MSTPVAVAQGEHGPVEAAERAEDEKHVCVGGAIVNSGRYVGYADSAACAGGGVDLVVAGALGEMLGCWVQCQEGKRRVVVDVGDVGKNECVREASTSVREKRQRVCLSR